MTQHTINHTLSSGKVITAAMPDVYKLAVSHLKLPNPMTKRIIELLEGAGLLSTATQKQREDYAAETMIGVIELASMFLVKPRLVLEDRPLEEGEVGPSAFAYDEWTELLLLFRGRIKPYMPTNSEPGTVTSAMADEPSHAVQAE